jgi:hypothetical protein
LNRHARRSGSPKVKYKISEVVRAKGVCSLESLEEVPDWPKLQHGFSQKGRFPADAYFQMSPDYPKDVKLADVLDNINQFLVVAERLHELLHREKALFQNETFPVAIKNHKGRTEKAKYFLVHQIEHRACVDEKKSVGEKSPIDKSQYLDLQKLVLDPKKIDKKLVIFRPAEYRDRPFFREDLAAKIEAEGFTGIEFFDVDTYENF